MSRTRFMARALTLGLLVFVLSCTADRPSPMGVATTPAPNADLVGDLLGGTTSLLQTVGLLKCNPMPTYTATKTIGSAGGVISVGPHALVIPQGALRTPTTITATAPSGRVNRVQFEPEGLEFERSATLSMSYANCNLLGKILPKRIAYVDDDLNILYYLLSLDILQLRRVQGRVDHFSSYAVAW
jgi:hypothetical protein